MQNEFEKQVQQKLEELHLVPSGPVWQKVEMQIREKRDRRRFLIWIPLFLLMAGTGLWLATRGLPAPFIKDKGIQEKSSPSPRVTTIPSPMVTITPSFMVTDPSTLQSRAGIRKTKSATTVLSPGSIPAGGGPETRADGKSGAAPALPDPGLHEQFARSLIPAGGQAIPDSVPSNDNRVPAGQAARFPQADTALAMNRDTVQSPLRVQRPDSSGGDTPSTRPAPTRKASSARWAFAAVAGTGLSGLGRFNVFNGQKSLNLAVPGASQSPPSYGTVTSPRVQKGISFSVGLAASHYLGKRAVLSTGLTYAYYSNSMTVGHFVRQDTVFTNSFAVSQYYRPSAPTLTSYRNRYHFVELPLALEWKLIRAVPVTVYTGLSLQQLLGTNALYFDQPAQVYYHDPHVFRKTQLSTEIGLQYSFRLHGRLLSAGPRAHYNLTRMEKDPSGPHLYSFSLEAKLQLGKKPN